MGSSSDSTGIGMKPALQPDRWHRRGAGLPPRPVRAAANDAKFDHGVIMDGCMDGETNPIGEIPWL